MSILIPKDIAILMLPGAVVKISGAILPVKKMELEQLDLMQLLM